MRRDPLRPIDGASTRGVSTWVADIHRDFQDALRRLFDLPAGTPMGVDLVGEHALDRVAVKIPAAHLALDLRPAHLGGAVTGATLALYARGLEEEPSPRLVAALVRRFRVQEQRDGGGLWEAAQRAFAVRDVTDHMYRDLSAADHGLRGIVRLGFRCNQDCGFCWQARDWPGPPPERYVGWVDELLDAGAGEIVFSGGEPTLSKDLPDLVRRARSRGAAVSVQTNAVRLGSPKYLARLVDAGLTEVFVSLHAGDPTLSDTMTRAPGTFGPTLRGIDAALAAGIRVNLNAVVEQRNQHRLQEHADLIVARFGRRIGTVQYSQPSRYRDPELRDLGLVRMSAVRPHLVGAVRTLLGAGISVVVAGTCGFPPCLFAGAPDLVQGLAASLFDGMDAASRSHPPECDGCALRDRCLGVRHEYLDGFGADGVVPFAAAPPGAREVRPVLRPTAAQPQG